MFKFLAVNVSVLCRVPCYRSLQCYRLAVHQKYPLFWKITVADTITRIPVAIPGCRLYTNKFPQQDVGVRADDIWTDLCCTNRLPVTDDQNCKEIIKLLLSFHYHKNHIVRELSENTFVLKFPVSRWKETISDLQSYGFQEPHMLPLLTGCDALLYGTAWDNLAEILAFLQSLQIPRHIRLQAIARNPLLLLADDTRPVMQKYSNLLKVFTKQETQMLIGKNPNVLTDTVEETDDKINYMYNEMGIRAQEITRSHVFEHSLTHLMTRHQFAERAGVYKKPDKHDIRAKEMKQLSVVANANPSLSDLVDTSNSVFAHTFCSMTVAEYKAFAEMIMEELHEVTEEASDSDLSDSDSDSE